MSSLTIPQRRSAGSPLRAPAHAPSSFSPSSALDEVRFELSSLSASLDALRASTPAATPLLARVERAKAAADAAASATERIAVDAAASVARAEAAAVDEAASASRRWRQREDEWRAIVVALRARQTEQQAHPEESAPAPPHAAVVTSSAALAASLSTAASLRAERDAGVAARAKLAEENTRLASALGDAEKARAAAEDRAEEASARERAAREREDAAREEAAAASATRYALSDRADALAAELEAAREAVRTERALGARITEAARRVRAELGAADGGRAALSAAAARSVSYLNAAANAIADPAAQAPSLKSLLVRTRDAALAALSPGRALTAVRAGSVPDAEPESFALATPDALRDAVERFINLVAHRDESLVSRAEAATRAEETLRLEATSEIRRLRGMLATLGHAPADGGTTRAPASTDYSAPLGASILDGEFASAAVRVDSVRTASSAAPPPARAQSATASLLPASLHGVAGVGSDADVNARGTDAADAPLAAQLIQSEFRIRELRIALHGAETRAAAAERAAEAAATRAATAAMASNHAGDAADESFTEAADDLDGSFYTARGPLSPPFATPARPGVRTAVGVTTARRPRPAAPLVSHAASTTNAQAAAVPSLISPADVAAFVAHVRAEEREAVLADVNAAAAAAVARAVGAAPGVGSGAAVALEALAAASAAATAAERDARRLRAQLQEVATAWEVARAELADATARARNETAAAEAERAAARTLADQAAALAYVSGTERDSALAQAANACAAADAAERAATEARADASAARANAAEIEGRVSARVAAAVASATDAEAARGRVASAAAVAAADAAGASRAEAAGVAALARALDSARADAARELEAALARAGVSAAERAAAALATGAASVRDAAAARAAAAAADAAAARAERDSALERIDALNTTLAAARASAAASAAAAREAAVRAAADAAAAVAGARADGAALCDAVKSHAEQDVASAYSAAHAAAIEASAREAAAADEVARATAAAAAAVDAARVIARKEITRRRALAARLSDIQGNIRVHVRLRPRAKDTASAVIAAEHDDDGDDEAALLRRAASGDTGYYEALTGEKLGGVGGSVSAAAHNAILSPKRGGGGARPIDSPPVVIANGDGSVLVRGGGTSLAEFDFDQVHESGAPQASVFDFVRPALDALLRTGAPTTICAYGQTGSGKTWTIEGAPKAPGVAARSIAHLFSGFRARGRATPELTISLLEIYNEHVCDLLDGVTDHDIGTFVAAVGTDMPPAQVRPRAPQAADEKYLELKGGASGRVAVPGATELRVHSLRAALGVLRAGAARRHTGAHALNAASSRSHLVIRIALPHEAATDPASPPPMLTIVDLAGSERVRRTGAAGERMNEATHINSSLSALGNVIAALRTRSPHVPFRDSKLTFLLRDVLQGPARVVVIACVSTDEADVSETLHTLQFAQRCRATALNLTAAATASAADVDVYADATARTRASLPVHAPALQPVAQSHSQVKSNLVRGGGGALVRRNEQPRRSVSVAPSPRAGVVLAKPTVPRLHVEPPPPPHATGSRVFGGVDTDSPSTSDLSSRGPVNAFEFERARTPPRPTSPARYGTLASTPEPALKLSSKLSASLAAAARSAV
jgi:hypothetical protein